VLSAAHLTYVFVTLLAMINPIEAAGAFETLTSRMPAADQQRIALRATLFAALILIAFGIVGNALFDALGISIEAFKIAGGLLLFKVGFDMVFADQQADERAASKEGATSRPTPDPSVFPLAIPIISGPGALTAIVAIFGKVHGQVMGYAIVIAIAVLVFAITFVAMRGASRLSQALGRSGVDAIGRLIGIVVAAIAIQLIVDGIGGLTKTAIH
jgi:multiple antibiotic resistance protein